jgi:magnesium-transporting ATPase (P-type)
MIAELTSAPEIVHRLRGRIRVHLPSWTGHGHRALERRVRQVPGVLRVEANPITSNVLVGFDPKTTDEGQLLTVLRRAGEATASLPEDEPLPAVVMEKQEGSLYRARIPVRGLDRDPGLARRVVERLRNRFGVRAWASPLTVDVTVEYDERRIDFRELLARVVEVELPDLPGEDRPAHPLDPAPLRQSATRAIGAALGLTFLTIRRLFGFAINPRRIRTAATLAGILGLLRSFPTIRNGLRRLFGPNATDLVFSTASIATLTVAASPLGLAVTGAEALLLFTEVAARRSAWRRYEERLGGASAADPGAVIRVEPGERAPLAAQVIEGTGTATGRDGLPRPIAPGAKVHAGAQLFGGPFVLQLEGGQPFLPETRPAPLAPSLYGRYLGTIGPLSLLYAAGTAFFTWSLARTFEALLLVNPRTAIIGMEAANLGAAARALRGGVTIVGTRRERIIRRPDVLLLSGPRLLTDGFEVAQVLPLGESADAAEVLELASAIAVAAGSPWGNAFPRPTRTSAVNAAFNGMWAAAEIDGQQYRLGPPEDEPALSEDVQLQHRGGYLLELAHEDQVRPLGYVALRPRLHGGVRNLVDTCRRLGTRLELLPRGSTMVAAAVARRAQIPLLDSADAVAAIEERQAEGLFVAFVSDSASAAPAFAVCDFGIGLSWGQGSRFPARADVLAADLKAVAALLEAGQRRDDAVRDGVLLSAAANVFGAIWGFRGRPGVERASLAVYVTALLALGDGWLRTRGGTRPGSSLAHLTDPRPERWGRRSIANVLRAFHSSETGLTSAAAAQRRRRAPRLARRHEVWTALRNQLTYPINLVLTGAMGVSLLLEQALDAAILGTTIAINVAVGVWQERQVGQAAEALQRLGTATAHVLRDGQVMTVPASEIVPGDVLSLIAGDRVAADARLLQAAGLEVDEATLTGESLPVVKGPDESSDAARVVLEGSDVLVGTGLAVVVAVGSQTRMGMTAEAVAIEETRESPLGRRLGELFHLAVPLALGGGAMAAVAGIFRGQALQQQLLLGLSTALSALPEGLPLLAGAGQAGVARRLAGRNAMVRRLAVVEALGRVDVACTDKTGTLTEGRLALRLVADAEGETSFPGPLPEALRAVLLTAALASPHPEAPDANAHPTDVAVVRAARQAGLLGEIRIERQAEDPFDPAQSFHATVVNDRLCIKGAPEVVVPRCERLRTRGEDLPLDAQGREALLSRARQLGGRGLRILLVAEGGPDTPVDDPQGLVVLGFLGISDPLRPNVEEAVRRCAEAGVRVIMVTGDHPATARAIAAEAGLLRVEHEEWRENTPRSLTTHHSPLTTPEVLTATDLAELPDAEFDLRIAKAVVIARATPLDKVRIIESLRRQGHTVAMTGDGVNDAPALRLADVGVAMGRTGTEVARQAADVVLADDEFATLVEALVEGRSFWRNMRRGVSLLLGGNAGELGLIVGASLLGFHNPLNTQQILVVNLITDALPALAVVLQRPEHRHLAGLDREGMSALDASLRADVLRRGAATGLPALAAALFTLHSGGASQARTVAFAGIVGNQLAQTLDAGRSEGGLSSSVAAAVGGSAGLLFSTLTLRPLRDILGLAVPTPLSWAVVGGSALAAVLVSRGLSLRNNHLAEATAPSPASDDHTESERPALEVVYPGKLPGSP